MEISDEDLRTMVREAVGRLARSGPAAAPHADPLPAHASHGRLALIAGGDGQGGCLIEPAVSCTHCGYCQSMGH